MTGEWRNPLDTLKKRWVIIHSVQNPLSRGAFLLIWCQCQNTPVQIIMFKRRKGGTILQCQCDRRSNPRQGCRLSWRHESFPLHRATFAVGVIAKYSFLQISLNSAALPYGQPSCHRSLKKKKKRTMWSCAHTPKSNAMTGCETVNACSVDSTGFWKISSIPVLLL